MNRNNKSGTRRSRRLRERGGKGDLEERESTLKVHRGRKSCVRSPRLNQLKSRPRVRDTAYVGQIDEIIEGKPLEIAPRPKRRRRVSLAASNNKSNDDSDTEGTGASPKDPGSTVFAPAPSPLPSSPIFCVGNIDDIHEGKSLEITVHAERLLSDDSDAEVTSPEPPRPLTALSDTIPPSPSAYVSIRTSRNNFNSNSKRHRPASPHREDKQNNSLNYGSEEDTDENEDDESTDLLLIPRMVRIFYDAEEDKTLQPPSGSIIYQWPPLPQVSSRPAGSPVSTSDDIDVNEDSEQENEDIYLETYRPTDMFEFDWRAFPKVPISPELRRETFSETKCGPTVSFDRPYDAFVAIWDRKFMDYIAVETNRYAQQLTSSLMKKGVLTPQSRITCWKDTTADELYVYFAIILAMGIVVKTRLDEYWSSALDIFSTPIFSVTMAYNRFLLLGRCLHFVDNDSCDFENISRSQAKLYKVQSLADHLNYRFSQLYTLGQNIALDECLTRWKGWLDINKFIPNKLAPVAIKTFEICESHTGYLWRFEIHTGEDSPSSTVVQTPLSGFIPTLVLRLLHGLEHKGHTVWMDNYYNSPALARALKSLGFDCVGTLSTSSQLVPLELATLQKSDMGVGQVCGSTSGDVDLIVWRDQIRVAMISTYHGIATTNASGTTKPTLLHDYNICMGGVDRKDQMMAMYPVERKRTRIWHKKFFIRLLHVSVLNAYIMYKHNHKREAHRSFRTKLINSLLKEHDKSQINPNIGKKFSPEEFNHYPAEYPLLPGQKQRNRRQCTHCSKRCSTFCAGCNIPLCVFTCFQPFHT